jgi:hypothetical protein
MNEKTQVTALAEYSSRPTGADERAEPWEAGNDPGVRVLVKRRDGSVLEVLGAGAGGVQVAQQGQGLAAHRLLDQRWLAHLHRSHAH